jgi:hypothetical protein
VRVLEISAAFGVWARLAVLTAGLLLAIDAWSWQGWIIACLVGWTTLVLLGDPPTGQGLRVMAAEAKTADGTIPASLLARIHHPRLWSSVLTRTGLIVGVITVMLGKPGLVAAWSTAGRTSAASRRPENPPAPTWLWRPWRPSAGPACPSRDRRS